MTQRIKVLVVCGTGVATSTVVATRVRDHLAARPDAARFDVGQGKVADLLHESTADIVVATTAVPAGVAVPVVPAVPLLTGIGADTVYTQIDAAIAGIGTRKE